MTENEMLKEICDKIGYNIDTDIQSDCDWFYRICLSTECGVDVREIIFTPEFMNKYEEHIFLYKDLWHRLYSQAAEWAFEIWIIDNLDDPVSYLYNLLPNGKE